MNFSAVIARSFLILLCASPLLNGVGKNIIVLGNGVTGTYTAAKLSKLGHKVTVIDADKNGGGRIKSFSYKEKKYDHGATAVGGHYDYVIPLVKKYNLTMLPVPPIYDLKNGLSLFNSTKNDYGFLKTIKDIGKYTYLTSYYPHQSPGYEQAATESILSSGTWDYLKDQKIESMERILRVVLPLYGYSHGYRETNSELSILNEVPMAHTVKVFSSSLSAQIMRYGLPLIGRFFSTPEYVIQEGFEELYSKIYEESLQSGVVYLNDRIESVSYSQGSGKVRLFGDQIYSCDSLICTIPPGNMTDLTIEGISSSQKKAILNLKYNYYGTTIFELSEEAHKRIPQRQYGNFEYSGYEPALLLNKFQNDPVWISYNYVKGLDQKNYDNSAVALKNLLSSRFAIEPEDVKVLSQRYVKYYPHPQYPDLMQSMAKTFSGMQGMYDGKLYFTGASYDFDIVDGVIRHADSLVEKYFKD
ncbi:FAD/NAD(P)-binding domain-containing protein [Candidatus Bealeia paramacronuclearis]|uniref:Tryptophan 2-monooxygenase n=1 Tax=Candidatus Bealeia paramacronuclearis TaxID=1921001 RepID=A0ABZ2C1S0_9PROT|nr:FAD/NAD(P)-binding domain-containing protein [Candidatus Bealeia paramacronuclearis]